MNTNLVEAPEVKGDVKEISEGIVLFILASVQFTHIMDFVIMMPMNPIFQEVFNIDNKQFGLLVSAYAASAGVSGFITFFFIDKLDRKKALLYLYSGFTLGTLGCAVADNYYFFLGARIFSGAFGGVLGALVMAIIGDVFHESKRGRATGIVMASFSVASIVGIPTGLYLAEKFDWHFPFYIIVGLSTIVIIVAAITFPNIKGHISAKKSKPFEMLKWVFTSRDPLLGILFMCLLMLAGFCIIPYLSDYFVSNIGFTQDDLKYIYLIGGSVTVISSPFAGRMADKFGKRKVFVIAAFVSIIPILAITSLPPVAKVVAFCVSATFFICFGARFVPAMAMMTSCVERSKRGGFMSISSSFQQLSSATAAFVGGIIIGDKVDGVMTNYWMVGVFAAIMTLACIWVAYKVKQVD